MSGKKRPTVGSNYKITKVAVQRSDTSLIPTKGKQEEDQDMFTSNIRERQDVLMAMLLSQLLKFRM